MSIVHVTCVHSKDLHECRLFDEYPRINWHLYPAAQHPWMSQHLLDMDVTQLAGMALDMTGTCAATGILSHPTTLPFHGSS